MDSIVNVCKNHILIPMSQNIMSIGKQYYQRFDQQLNSKDDKMDTLKPKNAPLIVSYEKYLLSLQSLLLWDNPNESIVALAIFTIAYW